MIIAAFRHSSRIGHPMRNDWRDIPGWCSFEQLYRDVVDSQKGPGVFVEVGCWKGQSTALLASLIGGKPIVLYAVDHFQGSDEPCQKDDPDLPRLRELFRENVPDWVRVKEKPSVEAAKDFEDASLDFVFLDAAHDYESVSADIEAWLPKIKNRGVLAGDDLNFPGVARAVRERLPDHQALNGGRQWKIDISHNEMTDAQRARGG